ncbi:GNAT family N-acetyltransferase [Streptomyces sp. P38-E01]|uniref:GNAT family N-acetyltransferase n=1 Tax=Streptomyces tardus TaxID=2780544 RepID=A0A949N5M0_9ACTN|nr:GNAT family protein [Streptomyces tardus]MBU7599089.1 GNAT family N-acetyltransferase [Streptomyces tardus]
MYAITVGDQGEELRPLEPWHAAQFLAHIDRGRELIGRHVRMADSVPDLAASRALLQRFAEKAAADTGRIFGIWRGEEVVGGVLFPMLDAEHGLAEAGCWLEPSAVGRGLVTRACRVIIDWAVEERGIQRVEWIVPSENAPSIAVARRLGMTCEGTRRSAAVHRGVRQDLQTWSVLADEWRAARER